MEFLIQNPVVELVFGLVSFLGVIMLGWSNLMVEPPKATAILSTELSVWERVRLRQFRKKEDQGNNQLK